MAFLYSFSAPRTRPLTLEALAPPGSGGGGTGGMAGGLL